MKRKNFWLPASASLLIFALAACGQATPSDGGAGGEQGASVPNAPAGHDVRATQPIPEGGWSVPYELPVQVTGIINVGSDWIFESGDDIHNSPWTRAWADELNVNVTWDWISTGNDYSQRLNMSIAAGNLPDVFSVNYIQWRQLSQAGVIMDITDYYNNPDVLSQRIRDHETTDPDTIKNNMVDGRIYGIPGYYYGIIDNPRHLWVRKDWYEALGSPEIDTVADLENLARSFMSDFGASYGISTSNTLEWLSFTGPMFGVYLGNASGSDYFWYPDASGRIKAGETHPEFKVALEYWQRWFAEGILSADFVNMDDMRAHEDVINSRVGIQPWWQWWGWMNGANLVGTTGNDDSYMIPLLFPTVEGGPAKARVGFPNGEVRVIHKDAPNPAAIMKVFSHFDHIMFSPESNLTMEQISAFTDGQREHAPGPFVILDPQSDMLQMINVQEALATGDTSNLFTAGMMKKHADSLSWINDRNPMGLGAFLQMGFEGSAYSLAQYLLDRNHYVSTSMWGPPPEEFDQTANTGDVIAMGVMQIIMGNQPVDYMDTVIDEWYAGGGQILEDAVNLHFGN